MIMKPVVYFSKTITAEKVLELYQKLGKELSGNVAVKVHSGEPGNHLSQQCRLIVRAAQITQRMQRHRYDQIGFKSVGPDQVGGKDAVEHHADERDEESRGARPAEEGVSPLPVAGGVVEGHERRHAETDADPHI